MLKMIFTLVREISTGGVTSDEREQSSLPNLAESENTSG